MKNSKLGIVVLNYNTWDETIQLIKTVSNTYFKDYIIYVVDNDSPQKITKEQYDTIFDYSNVEIIYNRVNKGYSAGNNMGIRKALDDNCDYIIIANSDVLFMEDSIISLIKYSNEISDAGIIGPTIYNVKSELQPFYMLTKLTGVGKIKLLLLKSPLKLFFQNFKNQFMYSKELKKPLKVFGVSGCCFLLTRECAKFLYPFDESTFLYEEEYIIGCKLEYSNYKTYIVPNAKVIHAHGISTGGMTKFSYECFIKSEQYYLKYYLNENIIIRFLIKSMRRILWMIYYKRKSKN